MTGPRQQVVLLSSDNLYNRHVATAVAGAIPLVGVVVETGARRNVRALPARLCRALSAGPGAALTRYRVERAERRLLAAAEASFRREAGERGWPVGVARLEVASVNEADAVAWCAARSPDLILVCGTSILRSEIIKVARLGILNVHTSVLPEYRGSFVEFWQALNNDFRNAGVTVHFVDSGIDTGDIVLQKLAAAAPGIDPYALRARNMALAAELLPQAARLVLDGRAPRWAQEASPRSAFRACQRTLERRAALLRQIGALP